MSLKIWRATVIYIDNTRSNINKVYTWEELFTVFRELRNSDKQRRIDSFEATNGEKTVYFTRKCQVF